MRLRLLLSFALVVLVTVASMVLIARHRTADEVNRFMFHGGMAGAEGLVEALENYYQANESWAGVDSLFSMPGHGRGRGNMGMMNQRLRLAGVDGRLLVDTAEPNPSGTLSDEELEQAIPLRAGSKTVGYLLPEGGANFTRGDETQLIGRLNRAALTAGLVAGGLSLFLALLLAYRLLRPIHALNQAAARLGQGDLSQRVVVRGSDELAALGQTFNKMAGSLQRSEENRRAIEENRRTITADIAHELRNPLAVQRANLEAMQDGVYPLTPDNLNPILEQNLLLTRLVEDLRTLALAESGQLKLERTPTDFPGLVQRAIERFDSQAVAQHVEICFSGGGEGSYSRLPLLVLDPLRVEQIISNLLSNALRFTPPGGRIDLNLKASPESILLTVHDSGPGIPEEALPHIFERFYRADRSRSRSEGGTGLGLAIARQLTEAHGGTLTAANHPQGGAVFELWLPAKLGSNRDQK